MVALGDARAVVRVVLFLVTLTGGPGDLDSPVLDRVLAVVLARPTPGFKGPSAGAVHLVHLNP